MLSRRVLGMVGGALIGNTVMYVHVALENSTE